MPPETPETPDRLVEWSRLSSDAMNAPYFFPAAAGLVPDLPNDADYVAFLDARAAEREALLAAVEKATSADDLPAEAREIFDRARQSIDRWMDDEDTRNRLYQDTGVQGVYRPPEDEAEESGDEAEGDQDGPLTVEEGQSLAAAILAAAARGDSEGANALAELSKDPRKARAVMAGKDDAPPARLSFDGGDRSPTESSSRLVDAILARGATAGVTITEEVREAIRALAKKKYPASNS